MRRLRDRAYEIREHIAKEIDRVLERELIKSSSDLYGSEWDEILGEIRPSVYLAAGDDGAYVRVVISDSGAEAERIGLRQLVREGISPDMSPATLRALADEFEEHAAMLRSWIPD